MKKILFIVCFILCLSFRSHAVSFEPQSFEEKVFLCEAFKNIQEISENEIFEKSILLEDYLIYERGGKSAFPGVWKNLSGKLEEIYNISFKKMRNYIPVEKKQKFKEILSDRTLNRFAVLGKELFNINVKTKDDALKVVDKFYDFFKSIGISMHLKDLNVKENKIEEMADHILANDSTMTDYMYVKLDKDALVRILKASM